MIHTDGTGNSVLSYDVTGRIARIPLERRGVNKKGIEWVLGSCLLEVFDEDKQHSARLYLVTFNVELIEKMNLLGVGKVVKVQYHIDVRDRFDGYSVSLIMDDISMPSEAENFLVGTRK